MFPGRFAGFGIALVAACIGPTALGATFTVTSTGNATDAVAGNGVCLTAGGVCTLRAAIQETNALAAGAPHTIEFAIPTTDPGFDAGTGVFTIVPATNLQAITRAGTVIDGTTQAASAAGNTNPGVLGTGGTIGVNAIALPQVQRPEIVLRDNAALTIGLSVTASNVEIRGLGIHGFGNSATTGDIVLTGATTGVRIIGNVLGSLPTALALPAVAAQQSAGNGVTINAPDNGVVQNNLIAFQAFHGIVARGGAAGWTISGNETRSNGRTNNAAGGIALEAVNTINNAISGNLVAASGGAGIDTAANTGPNTTVNNTVTGNGVFNNATAETAGIHVRGSNNLIDRNVVSANYGAGVMVIAASQTNRITRNSIFANGTIVNLGATAATNQIGIDLLAAANSQTRGTAPYASINDAGDTDAGGNAITNVPVLVTAERSGANLVVTGFARPGAVVELFVAAPDGSGFGEGQTYLTTFVEGSGADSDAGTGTYGPAAINGIAQGTDTTNRFTFTVPLASLPTAVPAGARLTATATLLNATSEFSGNVTVTEASADLTVTIADTPDPVAVGQPLTYTVTVTNAGPGAASAASISQSLPAGATFTGATPSQGTCSQLSGTVTCALGTMPPAGVATVLVTVEPTSTGLATSTVQASAPEPDPTLPNTAVATTTVTATADLVVAMTDTPDPVSVGQTITYTVVVSNAGPQPAFGVMLVDVVPAALTTLSATASQGSCTLVVSCALGTIPPGGSAIVGIVATANAPGAITNIASATTTSTDPAAGNNGASTTTTVSAPTAPPQPPDLRLDVHTSRSGVAPAGEFTAVTVVATNRGNGPANQTVISVRIGRGTIVNTRTSAGACVPTRDGPATALTCNVGRLEAGATATVSTIVQATVPARIPASASATSLEGDPTPADNTDVAAGSQAPRGSLSARIAVPARVRAGSVVPYTVTVRNSTTTTARDVVVAIAPPTGAEAGPVLVRSLNAGAHGVIPGRRFVVSVGDLAPGERRVIALTMFVRQPLGVRRIAAAAIAVDGAAGTHRLARFRVVAGLPAPPVTG